MVQNLDSSGIIGSIYASCDNPRNPWQKIRNFLPDSTLANLPHRNSKLLGHRLHFNVRHLLLLLSMNLPPKYSVVIPVYNRAEELDELLQSLVEQTLKNFEVIIVEDGSQHTAAHVYEKYSSGLSIQYIVKPNSGPGPSRNIGFEKARGEYAIVFDSDCILPPNYFESVEKHLAVNPLDAWGGPDRGHEKFTTVQRAMAYTMGSFLTTGGIRGGENQKDSYQPRSFNMGMSRKVVEKTGGFAFDRLAEDIELSIRMRKAGFRVGLIPDAFVYHKRRTNFHQFFSQVQGFGRGRVRVGQKHPGEVKLMHWFPAVFLLGLIGLPLFFIVDQFLFNLEALGLAIYLLAIFFDSLRSTKSFGIAILSVPSAIVQLTGYGLGFLKEKFG